MYYNTLNKLNSPLWVPLLSRKPSSILLLVPARRTVLCGLGTLRVIIKYHSLLSLCCLWHLRILLSCFVLFFRICYVYPIFLFVWKGKSEKTKFQFFPHLTGCYFSVSFQLIIKCWHCSNLVLSFWSGLLCWYGCIFFFFVVKWQGYYNYFENSFLRKAVTFLGAHLFPGERLCL